MLKSARLTCISAVCAKHSRNLASIAWYRRCAAPATASRRVPRRELSGLVVPDRAPGARGRDRACARPDRGGALGRSGGGAGRVRRAAVAESEATAGLAASRSERAGPGPVRAVGRDGRDDRTPLPAQAIPQAAPAAAAARVAKLDRSHA